MVDEDGPRVSADALLADAEREGRGRLRIFLGAAPGVGKTYAMLQAARAAVAAGRDVAIGVVETHGRPETEALLAGLEIIPRTGIAYRGRLLPDFDLDAALKRRPQLLLVDEYAHSNVPGSRHPKRWRDLQDCLKAGIDVWTTMNVQHVESLNDIVASFTRVRVRETVPDRILEQAEIEVVDIPPDELIERLKEGKVYIPQEATRALSHFFSKSNLSALRELALRRAAQAVGGQHGQVGGARQAEPVAQGHDFDRINTAIQKRLISRLDPYVARPAPSRCFTDQICVHLDSLSAQICRNKQN